MQHKARSMGCPVRIELTKISLPIQLAYHVICPLYLPNPSAECDTKSIFKRSKAGLDLVFLLLYWFPTRG